MHVAGCGLVMIWGASGTYVAVSSCTWQVGMPLSQDIADVLGNLQRAISGCSRVLALEYLTNVNKWLFLWWESRLLFRGAVENDPGPWNKEYPQR